MSCNELAQATTEHPLKVDESLRHMSRAEVLKLDAPMRVRWFYLLQVRHAELMRVTSDLQELLEPNNETKIISVIGMTGIGKTTLANSLIRLLNARYANQAHASEIPVLYVRAPANGDRKLSLAGLYRRILEAAGELLLPVKRAANVSEGELQLIKRSRFSLPELRSLLETMLVNRNVRALVIDEALHLLRCGNYSALMDTLKSLADVHSTKLVLIGAYDIAPLMTEYGQVARRSEIIHYRRYWLGKVNLKHPTPDQREFRAQVRKFQNEWPCALAPNLDAAWDALMKMSLGSIGLLKVTLLRLATLQMGTKGEVLNAALITKAFKAPKSLKVIEEETIKGEETLRGACYGDSPFGSDEDLNVVTQLMMAA